MIYIEDKTFQGENFSISGIEVASYENCHFVECNLLEVDLSKRRFIDCHFSLCDLSMAKLSSSEWRNVRFKDCKMLGLLFDECEPQGFQVEFDTCILNHSSFVDMRLKKIKFDQSSMIEIDFSAADLSGSVFNECDFSGSKFIDSNLRHVDLRTCKNMVIDPHKNSIQGMKISISGGLTMLEQMGVIIDR